MREFLHTFRWPRDTIDTMNVCYVCRSNQASSREHVIPNALGGRWKARGLLCKSCNVLLGHTTDVFLSKEFGVWMNLLSLSRERKDVPSEAVQLEGRGDFIRSVNATLRMTKPMVSEERTGNQVSISIEARSKEEIRRLVKGYRRKYGDKVDIEKWMTSYTERVKYLCAPTIYRAQGVGSPETLRSVAKIAANAYLAWGGSLDHLCEAACYIRGDTRAPLVRWYFESDPVKDRNRNSVTHVIAVRGDPHTGTLWAYVELFFAFRFAVNLCRAYKGERFERHYAYDLCTASPTPLCIEFNAGDLDPEVGGLDVEKVKAEIGTLMRIAARRSRDQILENIIKSAFAEAMSKHPGASTEDLLPILMDKVTPALKAILRIPDPSC